MGDRPNLVIKSVGEDLQYACSDDPFSDIRQIIGAPTDSRAVFRSGDILVRMHLDDEAFRKNLPPNFPYPNLDADIPGTAVFTCEDPEEYVAFDDDCLRAVHDIVRGLFRQKLPPEYCDPVGDFWERYSHKGSKSALILLPLSRLISDDRISFDQGRIVIYPPVVDWGALDIRIPGETMAAIEKTGALPLGWHQNASSGLGIEDLEPLALCALVLPIDKELFLSGNHKYHAGLIRDAADKIEDLLDILRFEQCKVRLPEMLPGRAGHIPGSMFSSAVIYLPGSTIGIMIGNAVETHAIVGGVGLDANSGDYARIEGGEIAMLMKRGLAMFSDFLAASRQTQQFMLGISLLEFLASPDKYTKMKEVKREIASHVARDKSEYHYIGERFRKLTSMDGDIIGLRTQIIHHGRTFEDIVQSREDRIVILEELERYASICLHDMFRLKEKAWADILQERVKRREQLGVA